MPAGMTFFEPHVVRVLEEDLPARFGGGPTDHELLEDARAPESQLRPLVHPSVRALQAGAVLEGFLAANGSGTGPERVMALHWTESGMLRVERCPR